MWKRMNYDRRLGEGGREREDGEGQRAREGRNGGTDCDCVVCGRSEGRKESKEGKGGREIGTGKIH
ncbi:hypothetical protein Pmani_031724, partial [Petrolisthes manimaculis]